MEIREITQDDMTQEYFDLLCQLSGIPTEVTVSIKGSCWWHNFMNENHITFVAVTDGEIVGTASVLIERKMLHHGSKVGHIEDVVVDSNRRIKGTGKELIKKCVEQCRYKGCYKAILDCSDENIPFYEACDFFKAENCMRMNLEI